MYFHENIENWQDWSRVFQSIQAFAPLAKAIFEKECLPLSSLSPLTPGTNGVFRCGNFVLKIFFPKESGLDPLPDFRNESAVCTQLTKWGIPTPRLIAKGEIQDKYLFYYLITEYFPGKEGGEWLKTASPAQKESFAVQLKALLLKLNRPADDLIPPVDLKKRALTNPRLRLLPANLAKEMTEQVKNMALPRSVLVHGDLTGENLLVDSRGRLVVIDCADACLAPWWYELAPIVFELFRCDKHLLSCFFREDRQGFISGTISSLCIHDFGGGLLTEAMKYHKVTFNSLSDVEKFLAERC